MDIAVRYPKAEVRLQGLSVRIGPGVKNPEQDPLLARVVTIDVHDECFHEDGSWWLPCTPEVMDRAKRHLNVTFPPDAQARVAFLARAEEARKRANIWRKRPISEQRAWLDKLGVDFPEKYQPFAHQVTSVGYALQNPVPGLLLDTGLGKTYVISILYQALKKLKNLGPFLVVAPKSILRMGWGRDIEKFTTLSWLDIGDPPAPPPITACPVCKKQYPDKLVPKAHLKTHLKVKLKAAAAASEPGWPAVLKTLVEATKTEKKRDPTEDEIEAAHKAHVAEAQEPIWEAIYKRFPALRPAGTIERRERVTRALARTDVDVFVINPEQAKAFKEELKARKFSVITVDESSMMRAHDSQTTAALIDLAWSAPRRIAMSGTPRPNSNLELWGQFAMLDACFGHRYRVFRDKFFQVDYTGYQWLSRPGKDVIFSEMIEERTLRYKLEDCVDLPGEMTETREVELNDELREHYKTMLEDMIVELEDETVSTPYKLVQINKLAQITSGFIFDAEKNALHLSDKNPKMQETISVARRLVEEEGRSVVIWVRFSELEAEAIKATLGKYGVSTLIGGQSSTKTENEINKFLSRQNKIMVANPASAKFGHTWVHATVCIFHSYDYSWENYYQAKHRIYRIGQANKVTYINIVARKTVDKIIMAALARKEDESAVVIDRKFISELKKTL